MFAVNIWGSHPEAENDDWWSSREFSTKEEALECFNNPVEYFGMSDLYSTEYIELCSLEPGDSNDHSLYETIELRINPDFRPSHNDDSEWRRERAMQAGMAFGCDGYNDEMGY